jgi:superfamily II DNA helicase RecQ
MMLHTYTKGVDKPNVKTVIHISTPSTIEDYSQEAGRAGRDGSPGVAILFLSNKRKSDSAKSIKKVSASMEMLINGSTCLRRVMNSYLSGMDYSACPSLATNRSGVTNSPFLSNFNSSTNSNNSNTNHTNNYVGSTNNSNAPSFNSCSNVGMLTRPNTEESDYETEEEAEENMQVFSPLPFFPIPRLTPTTSNANPSDNCPQLAGKSIPDLHRL